MKLSQFKFKLPESLIAQYPVENRDESRLMVVDCKDGSISHHVFKEVINYFDEGDVLIFNDTKVFPARLLGNKEKTGAIIEVFLLRELNSEHKFWDVLVEPARKIRIGNKLYFGDDDSLVAEVIDNTTSRGRTLRFLYDGDHDEFKEALFALGGTPLPDYIKRDGKVKFPEYFTEDGSEDGVPLDAERYQCIFAKNEGAVMAPAAGLHFSRELMKRLEIKGVERGFLTLHSGRGNFREIDVEDLTKHRMDSEEMYVREDLVDMVNAAKDRGNRVCAVGTSVMRGVASSVCMNGHLMTYEGWTNKFIFPPYDFTVCDSMITNFHLPYSTMLMMTCAFGGYDLVMKAYHEAVKNEYRFGAYGDAMLILR